MAESSSQAGTVHEDEACGGRALRFDLSAIREESCGAEARGFCEASGPNSGYQNGLTSSSAPSAQELHRTGFALLRTPESMHADIDAIQDAAAGAAGHATHRVVRLTISDFVFVTCAFPFAYFAGFFALPTEVKEGLGEFQIVSGKARVSIVMTEPALSEDPPSQVCGYKNSVEMDTEFLEMHVFQASHTAFPVFPELLFPFTVADIEKKTTQAPFMKPTPNSSPAGRTASPARAPPCRGTSSPTRWCRFTTASRTSRGTSWARWRST